MLLNLIFCFTGCNTSDNIDEGVYISSEPYIKITCGTTGTPIRYMPHEIEIDGEIHQTMILVDYGGTIFFFELQEEDMDPNNIYLRTDNNERYGNFDYKFDKRNKRIILKKHGTKETYILEKQDTVK